MSAQAVEPVLDKAALEDAVRTVLQQADAYRVASPVHVSPTGAGLYVVAVMVGPAELIDDADPVHRERHLTAVTS